MLYVHTRAFCQKHSQTSIKSWHANKPACPFAHNSFFTHPPLHSLTRTHSHTLTRTHTHQPSNGMSVQHQKMNFNIFKIPTTWIIKKLLLPLHCFLYSSKMIRPSRGNSFGFSQARLFGSENMTFKFLPVRQFTISNCHEKSNLLKTLS